LYMDRFKRVLHKHKSEDIHYYLDMKSQLRPGVEALKLTIIYGMLGVIWIAFPVEIIGGLIHNMDMLPQINIYKGWAFVGISAVTIFIFALSRLRLAKGALRHLELNLMKQKMIEQELNSLAYYDILTKLPNRALLEIKCAELVKNNCQFAFVCMDVDNFKNINDTLGHLAGDQFLKELADRLLESVGRNAFIARLGGDEFAMIFAPIYGKEEVEYKLQRIQDKLKNTWKYEGQHFHISVSMGVALYPEQADNLTLLLRNSDIAMYANKKLKKENYCFYSEELNRNNSKKLMLTNELHKAIQNDEFLLLYQPIVDINTRDLIGVEALIRWKHPEHGMISPLDFIPLAEETGLIEEIERWVIKTAFLQKKIWDELLVDRPKLMMSINISGNSFVQYGFVNYIRNMLLQSQLNSNEIQLEITETVFIDKAELSKMVFNDISSMGLQIALDDFGTGYSSLTYLKNFPIDVVKLDANFVKGIINDGEDRSIVEAVIKLTHDLGLTIIAEGIEAETQHNVLKNKRCDYGQGYLYSRPVSADKIMEMLENEILEYAY